MIELARPIGSLGHLRMTSESSASLNALPNPNLGGEPRGQRRRAPGQSAVNSKEQTRCTQQKHAKESLSFWRRATQLRTTSSRRQLPSCVRAEPPRVKPPQLSERKKPSLMPRTYC